MDELSLALKALQQKTTIGDDLQALAAALKHEHGQAVVAILYYGSCLRSGNASDGIADFYVLVDSYRNANMGVLRAGLNRLLPPNVFYLETSWKNQKLRAKYAVISIDQFEIGVSGGWFLPYLWGRFAQPSGVLWSASEDLSERLYVGLSEALKHFVEQIAPLLPDDFEVADLWRTGLRQSYKTELRAEREERILGLYDYWPEYYIIQTQQALKSLNWLQTSMGSHCQTKIPIKYRKRSKHAWRLRILLGKPLALLRLIKSLLTFRGALEYAVWKIERHSGRPVNLPEYARRWPLLGGWVVLWQLLRRGSLR